MVEEIKGTAFYKYLVDNYNVPTNGFNFNYLKGLKKIWDHKEDEIRELEDKIIASFEDCHLCACTEGKARGLVLLIKEKRK